jgi:hypothetical protein
LADAERSLLFVIRASVEDFNKKLKDAEKNFKHSFGQIQKELDRTANQFLTFGGAITGIFTGMIMKAAESSDLVKAPLDRIKGQFDLLFKTIAENPAVLNLLNQFADLMIKVVEWISKHPELVKAFLAVGLAITAVGLALKGAAIAMSLLQAFSGPGGLVKLAIGAIAAAGALVLINKMTAMPPTETPEIPAMQHGGIFRRPTLAMIGEVPEAVMPLSRLGSLGGIGGGGTTLNVHVGNFMGDDMSLRAFARTLEQVLRQEGNRSSFGPSETELFSQGGHL